jgi:hypothetical protein
MTAAAQMLTVRVPLAVRKPRGGRKLILTPGGMAPRGASAADTTLVKALARAFRWRKILETGRYGTIDELAAAEKINSSYVSRLLRLTLLSPQIVEAILDGRQPEGMTLPGLMEPFPVEWEQQGVSSQQTTPITAFQTHPLANAHRRPGQTQQRRS